MKYIKLSLLTFIVSAFSSISVASDMGDFLNLTNICRSAVQQSLKPSSIKTINSDRFVNLLSSLSNSKTSYYFYKSKSPSDSLLSILSVDAKEDYTNQLVGYISTESLNIAKDAELFKGMARLTSNIVGSFGNSRKQKDYLRCGESYSGLEKICESHFNYKNKSVYISLSKRSPFDERPQKMVNAVTNSIWALPFAHKDILENSITKEAKKLADSKGIVYVCQVT